MKEIEEEISIRKAICQAIDEEMTRDESVFLLGEEVAQYNGAYKVSEGLWKKWGGRRIIDTPISESSFTGFAIGAALKGLRPIVEFMSFNFSFVAVDQIANRACKMHYMSGGLLHVPIVFRGPNGAANGVSCQHSHSVESFYANFPGLKIVVPSNSCDAKGLLKSAIRDDNPVIFLENELMYDMMGKVPKKEFLIPFGCAKIVQEGESATLVTYGRMILPCLEVVTMMQKRGISIELIDLRSIKPIDTETIFSSVRKTHRVVLVEEGHRFSGINAEISAQINEHCFDDLDAPVVRVCQLETPLPYSSVLEAESIPNAGRIMREMEKIL